ncbi:MAG: hypothetical protein M3N32_05975 [Actinomycetota bacterium]|nr:hypothetical protein [Actinomycetota bacterium]
MSSFFEGFDLGKAREVRIRSYTVGPGRSAQLTMIELEVWLENAPDPQVVEVDYGDDGPAVAAVQAMVVKLNRQLQKRRGGEP